MLLTGHQILKSRHSSVAGTQLAQKPKASLRGTHLHCCFLPKQLPLLCARDSCLEWQIISVATPQCTRVFSVQQEVHKLCHTGGRDWSNILKHDCPQEQNREENKMDEG